MVARIVNILIGIWITIAPSYLGYSLSGSDSCHIAGPLIVTFAITAIWEVNRSARYANMLVGIWLLIAPWILQYPHTLTTINDMACGFSVAILSLSKGKIKGQYGGGWKSLIEKSPLHAKK